MIKFHTHVDRRGAGTRADAIVAGHSVLCAETGDDSACPGRAMETASDIADRVFVVNEVSRPRKSAVHGIVAYKAALVCALHEVAGNLNDAETVHARAGIMRAIALSETDK